jgi:acylphosphatase
MTARKKVLVSGRVQGVFFRDECRRRAEVEGVSGSVRNLADGQVEAVFEGPDDAVQRMIDWCHEGPAYARVDHVEVEVKEPQGETGFRVA